MQIHQILAAVDARYPLAHAEKWDKVGLQIGDARGETTRVLVAHEVTAEVIEEARDGDALVVYHPMIFRALENLNFAHHTASLAAACIRKNLTVIAAHTALDNALPPNALGDALAREIGLENVEVLAPSGREDLLKLVVFVPDSDVQAVSDAMWNAGAGKIGNYDRASFRASGQGTFRPLPGADPAVGEIGRDETTEEWRLEVLLPAARLAPVLQAMKNAHSYEEIAHEIYPIRNTGAAFGSGRRGTVQRQSLEDFSAQVRSNLEAPSVRVVQSKDTVEKVACVPGSGASFLKAAARAGCDCLVTGDIKHHDALKAKALGISIIDVTHVATERSTIEMLAGALAELPLEIVRSAVNTNPFS